MSQMSPGYKTIFHRQIRVQYDARSTDSAILCPASLCPQPVPPPNVGQPELDPGMTPQSPNGDGLYWDVNGDGKVDFYDVIDFFINLEWIAAERVCPVL